MADYDSSQTIQLNSSTQGSISPTGDSDGYRFTVTSAGVITIFTTGSTDTYGILYEVTPNPTATPTTRLMTFDFSSGDELNFRLSAHLNAGEYYVDVRSGSGDTGDYILVSQFILDSATAPTTREYNQKLKVPSSNIPIFAESATSGNRTLFGETTTADDITSNLNTNYYQGWGSFDITNKSPKIKDFNAMCYTSSHLLRDLYYGIPSVFNGNTYQLYSIKVDGGVRSTSIYSSKVANNTALTTDTTKWDKILLNESQMTTRDIKLDCFSMIYNRNSNYKEDDKILRTTMSARPFTLIEQAYPDNSLCDLANRYFIARKSGTYYISATITFEGSQLTNVTDEFEVLLSFVNDNGDVLYKVHCDQHKLCGNDKEFTTEISTLLNLDAGDKVKFSQFVIRTIDGEKVNTETFFGIATIRFNGNEIL